MSFPILTFFAFVAVEDDKYFQDTPVDPTIRYETQGGLVVTRRRFTRAPSRIIMTGYTMISLADKALFDTFYTTWAAGGAAPVSYIHPLTGETLNVRFDAPYKTKYTGIGVSKLWDITDITLRTV